MASGVGKVEGQGFSLSFAVLAIILNLLDVNVTGPSVTSINCSDQSTTGFEEYIASTLQEGGNYTFNIQWNLEDQVSLYASVGVDDTMTVTWPIGTAGNTAASDGVPGYIESLTKVSEKGTIINGVLVWKVADDVVVTNEFTV